MKETLQKKPVVFVLAGICSLLWGSAFPCIKLGYQWFAIDSADTATIILFAGLRFFLAGFLVLIFGSVQQKTMLYPRKKEWKIVARLSVYQTILQYLFFYLGLAHTSGVKASIVESLNIFVAIAIASLIFRLEKLDVKKCLGCMLGVMGIIVMNSGAKGMNLSFSFMGEGFIFLSTVAYGISSAKIKGYTKEYSPVMLSGAQFVFGGLVMILIGLLFGGRLENWNAKGAGMLVYLAMVSAVAYTLWGILLKYNPVSQVTIYGFLNPVFGVILSVVLIGEGQLLTMRNVIALVFVCLGICVALMEKQNRAPGKKVVDKD